ncbi:EAL domain-containing protein [Alteripontixanthobacter muriae]|uniref:EAL domain-containing protein n=1 Tax=Alteripontixanthobacter muriae TaxID=2705546 RepID=UPI001E4F90BB|nr:EAL domain-containing protein [Alteripontixanthobacter muriae]
MGDRVDDSRVYDDPELLVPKRWTRMGPILAATYAVLGVINLDLPPIRAIIVGLLSILLAFLAGEFLRMDRERQFSRSKRLVMVSFAMVAPVFASGACIAMWMVDGGLHPIWGVATLLSLTGIATYLLNGRILLMFAAKVVFWLPFVLLLPSLTSLGSAIAMIAVFTVLARGQFIQARERAIVEEAKERIRNRADDILRDYEDMGHGWFWQTDRRGNLTYLSAKAAATIGKSPDDVLGRHLTSLFSTGDDSREGERTVSFHLSARSQFHELAVRAAAEEERWWAISGRPVFDDFANYCGFRGSGSDLTEKRLSQQKATRLAQYDSLTGLANRLNMAQSLERILAARQDMQRECAVFLLDLDRFKNVNDTLGHPAGDALLKQVSQRLERAIGKSGQVGRLGGDEFQIITPGRLSRERLEQLGQDIIHSLSQPYSIEGQRVVIGASVGIAIAPEHGTTAEELIRNSDLALYAAKDGGRGRLYFYADTLHSAVEERNQMEQDLRDALQNGGLELFYQPVVHSQTERIAGFEALLRWNHPVKGWLSPAKFVPVAEDSGLIINIGEWALQTACRDLGQWPEEVRCAVNVSALQFANPHLPSVVASALADAGVDPSRLELEITESVFLSDDRNTDVTFAALKKVGVRLALDDFGTGYSSLGYLKKAPFDKIKIDQSFVRGATEKGSRNGAIIASITSLAQALGMDTTAEGVETLDELDLIRRYGCSHIQGFIFNKPMPANEVLAKLAGGLKVEACGPQSARVKRNTMLRKIVLEHGGQFYNGTIRNISATGALVEGLWNVPVGTIFRMALTEKHVVTATCRWGEDKRMGVEFLRPLELDRSGAIIAMTTDQIEETRSVLRKPA